MGARLVLGLCLACLAGLNPPQQTRPDFSGKWTFDRAKSAQPWNGRGDIPVTSRASWSGDTLVIVSTSASSAKGEDLTIETRRVVRLDADGNLIIERTGTPASEVTPSRSVYTRVR